MAEQTDSYIAELISEKSKLDASLVHCTMLIAQEIDRVQTGSSKDKMIDVHADKPTQISTKIRIPCKDYPKVNYVGRILGQKGSNMKRIQEETGTKISVQGRGSMRDPVREEELRKEGGKYAHLTQDLHVHIETYGKPADCHQRMANAILEISKYLSPDYVEEETDIYSANGSEIPAPVPGWPSIPPGPGLPPMIRGRGPEMLRPRPPMPPMRPPRLPPYGAPGLLPPPGGRVPPPARPMMHGPRPVGLRPPHLPPRVPGPSQVAPRLPHYGAPPLRPFVPSVHSVEPVSYETDSFDLIDVNSSAVEDFTSDDWAKNITNSSSRGKAATIRPGKGRIGAHPYAPRGRK